MIVSVFIPGEPKTAGSKRAFVIPAKGDRKARAIVTDDAGVPGKAWRADVRARVEEEMGGAAPLDGPILLRAIFYLPRRKGDIRADGRTLTSSAPLYHVKVPDATKLLRAVEDALIGLAYRDDKQVVTQIVQKRYAEDGRVGASLMFGPLDEFAERALVDLRPPT